MPERPRCGLPVIHPEGRFREFSSVQCSGVYVLCVIPTIQILRRPKLNRYLALSLFLAASLGGASQMGAQTGVWTDSLLEKIRAAATMIPGTPPRSVHVLRFAPHEAPQSTSLDGGSNELICMLTLSVYQIRFTDGWIMVDAGIDQSTFASRVPGATIPQVGATSTSSLTTTNCTRWPLA